MSANFKTSMTKILESRSDIRVIESWTRKAFRFSREFIDYTYSVSNEILVLLKLIQLEELDHTFDGTYVLDKSTIEAVTFNQLCSRGLIHAEHSLMGKFNIENTFNKEKSILKNFQVKRVLLSQYDEDFIKNRLKDEMDPRSKTFRTLDTFFECQSIFLDIARSNFEFDLEIECTDANEFIKNLDLEVDKILDL